MSENISLDLIGRTLLAIQADMRSVRDENALTRNELGRMARREELLDVLRVISDRIAAFEATVLARMDETERSIEERLARIEALLTTGRSIEAELAEELDRGGDGHG